METAELRKPQVVKKLNRAILCKMTFVNDFKNCCFFWAKLMCNKRKILRFVPQKFCERKPFFRLGLSCAFGKI